MSYQLVTITESTGKTFQFVCPVLDETKHITAVTISPPTEQAPLAAPMSRKALKTVSYMLSVLALHLNLSYK